MFAELAIGRDGTAVVLVGAGSMKDLNLAGDIMDANISPLTRAVAGEKGTGKWPRQMGFRRWQLIFSKMARSILVTPTNRGKQTQESLGLTKQID